MGMCRNSEAYKNQALTIYQGPVDSRTEESAGSFGSNAEPSGMDVQDPEDNSMEEESDASYQTQLRETGMQGMPLPDMDDPSWSL